MRSDLALLSQAAFGYLPLAALAVGIAAPLAMLLLAATDQEGGLKVFDALNGQELAHRHLETKFGNYLSARFTPDGTFLAFNDYADWPETEVIKFWNPVTQQDLGTVPGWRGSRSSSSSSPGDPGSVGCHRARSC